MTLQSDFIEVYEAALGPEVCALAIKHFGQSKQTQPGQVGGGVYPELKNSRDLTISALPEWAEFVSVFNGALLKCMRAYVRKYPYVLLAPFMLASAASAARSNITSAVSAARSNITSAASAARSNLTSAESSGASKRMDAASLLQHDDAALNQLILRLLRPGAINIQRYTADQGGYPYWHCEHMPSDAQAESLHRTLLWTLYLNEDFTDGETEFLHQARKIKPKTGALLIAPTAFTHTHRGNKPRGGDKYIATSWVLFQRAEMMFAGAALAARPVSTSASK